MGAFVITKRFDGKYKFEYTSRKGNPILTSNSFELKFECEAEIELLKSLIETCVFLKVKTSKGKYFFRIIFNDRLIAISRKYATELMLQKGINEIIKYGAKAETLDFLCETFIFPY